MKLSFRLKKSSEFIFDYLTDMQKYTSIHPVISQIDKTGEGSYLVHETLKIGFIPISFAYPVTIEHSWVDKVVSMRATVFKLTKIEMKFEMKTDGDYTEVEETIHFKSPLPVKFVMQRIFRKQHTELFKNMELKLQYI